MDINSVSVEDIQREFPQPTKCGRYDQDNGDCYCVGGAVAMYFMRSTAGAVGHVHRFPPSGVLVDEALRGIGLGPTGIIQLLHVPPRPHPEPLSGRWIDPGHSHYDYLVNLAAQVTLLNDLGYYQDAWALVEDFLIALRTAARSVQ